MIIVNKQLLGWDVIKRQVDMSDSYIRRLVLAAEDHIIQIAESTPPGEYYIRLDGEHIAVCQTAGGVLRVLESYFLESDLKF